ncbi:LysR family transcriptional regulator [Ciceribacter sp. L1K23]|uniref:LysR family transcriptional regulator n=1 Tax=Ciceribacter sp. L1K23 TaxID=2820276 RepID=UPI001B82FF72|nr:LysR family transcriptional regulator [Ciceribacter sp. L1K23]MBR0556256.1 LysR family transcriptional regulator [Ciceribacter sp. L1K23]
MKTIDPLSGIAAFLSVAQSLSFTKAAEELQMSRATVSAQIHDLETRLGTRLLQRTTRAVSLTEAGTAYLQALSGVLPQIREAERAAASFQQEAVGRMRISTAPDLGPDHVAPAVAAFLKLNPGLSIDLDLSLDTVNLVEENFDLAIRGTISLEPNVITRQIGSSPVVVCAAPDYLARHGVPSHPNDLTKHACLHFSKLRWGRVWHFSRGETSLRVPVLPRLECNDGRTLFAAAVAGAGIVLEPAFVVGPAIREGKLVAVLPEWSITTIPVHAVYPANRHIAMKVKSFVSFLIDHLSGHPDLT